MTISPITEDQADEEIKKIYQSIKRALNTNHLPIFFTYLAPFPEYFLFITNQTITNLKDQNFNYLIGEMSRNISLLINQLPKSQEIIDWLNLYKNTSSFYNFQLDLKNLFIINLKISIIFIAIRESIKGWAIGARKLKEKFEINQKINQKEENFDKFVFNQEYFLEKINQITLSQKGLILKNNSLEKNLLPEYLRLCRNHFFLLTKGSDFWNIRVGIEKILLEYLDFFPTLITSSFSQVVELTKKHPHFDELIYLLFEKFPTLSVQRLMFSGFLLKD